MRASSIVLAWALAIFVVIISPSASMCQYLIFCFTVEQLNTSIEDKEDVAQQLRLVDQLEEDMAWQRRSKKD